MENFGGHFDEDGHEISEDKFDDKLDEIRDDGHEHRDWGKYLDSNREQKKLTRFEQSIKNAQRGISH